MHDEFYIRFRSVNSMCHSDCQSNPKQNQTHFSWYENCQIFFSFPFRHDSHITNIIYIWSLSAQRIIHTTYMLSINIESSNLIPQHYIILMDKVSSLFFGITLYNFRRQLKLQQKWIAWYELATFTFQNCLARERYV